MSKTAKHIIIDARIRRASTGRPVDRLLHYLPKLDSTNRYTILLEANDDLEINASNFSIVHIDYKQFSFNPLRQISYTLKLRSLKPDLVFFTMTGQAPMFYFGKSVTFTHDLTMLRFVRAGRLPAWAHWLRMMGYRLLFWKGNRFAKKIIVPSKFVADDLSHTYRSVSKKTQVVYEASEPPLKVKSEKIKDDRIRKPFIFHVGSPFPHKNIEGLVDAYQNLLQNHPDLTLILAGKKEYYFSKLEAYIAERALTEKVVITGFIADEELKWLYENAEAYVLPSLSEGFGLPGLEAMAHSCPLVSSSATCLPEIYGKAAEYFDPHNIQSMAESIEKVLVSEKRRQELIAAGQKQIKQYSWDKMADELHAILSAVV